ncbi:hypothetical protein [Pedobacter sp. Leaf132]|uniref:hypothetical protein n=1 Tax=Pedobacter sp. Leaf132 TaxID=2876557 RepID=UPI001E32D4E1|nr:hypothetical protein [Pedobacter sp. Leaf132]
MYNLGGVDLSDIPFIAGVQNNSDIALSGLFDMPARLGKTFHDWGDEDGIEPYVSASEIFFGGRDLSLTGFIKGNNKSDCNDKLGVLYNLINSFTDTVPLQSDWGSFNVYVNAPIVGNRLSDTILSVTIPFREPVVDMTPLIPIGDSSQYGIDGNSFALLGGEALKLSGDSWNRTNPKTENISFFGKEKAFIGRLTAPEHTLTIGLRDESFIGLRYKVKEFMALLASPGVRKLVYPNDKLRAFFVKDGFKTTALYAKRTKKFCVIDIKITEVNVTSVITLENLIDYQKFNVTDSDGNNIKLII